MATSEEVLAEHVKTLGQEDGSVFNDVYNQICGLHVVWGLYTELYGTSAARVALLNQSASTLFKVVQDALWHETLLSLCRLTDPPQTRAKSNVTVRRLEELNRNDAGLKKAIERAQTATEFARDWRNRRVAHRDLGLATGQQPEPLARARRVEVDEALDAMDSVLKHIYSVFFDSDIRMDALDGHSAKELLFVLRDGLEAREERHQRLKSGGPAPGDYGPPAPI